MRENLFRLWFVLLMMAVMLLAGKELFGQDKPRFKVKIKAKLPPAIKLDVLPKIAMIDPYSRRAFRVRVTIEPDDRNVRFSLAADCGYDAYGSNRSVESITDTRFIELRVVQPCIFHACVFRLEEKEVKSYCATVEVRTPEGG